MSGESISQIAIDGVEVDSILRQYDCVGGARWYRRVTGTYRLPDRIASNSEIVLVVDAHVDVDAQSDDAISVRDDHGTAGTGHVGLWCAYHEYIFVAHGDGTWEYRPQGKSEAVSPSTWLWWNAFDSLQVEQL